MPKFGKGPLNFRKGFFSKQSAPQIAPNISNEIFIEINVGQTQSIPDLQEVAPTNISATVTSLGAQKVCEFLKSNCPALVTESTQQFIYCWNVPISR